MIKKISILLTVLLVSIHVIAQRVNAFARATSISGTTFNVANVEENLVELPFQSPYPLRLLTLTTLEQIQEFN